VARLCTPLSMQEGFVLTQPGHGRTGVLHHRCGERRSNDPRQPGGRGRPR
jgi:hypothetical protein